MFLSATTIHSISKTCDVKGRCHVQELGIDVRLILVLILKIWFSNVWIGFNFFKLSPRSGLLQRRPLCSIEGYEILTK